MIDSIFSTGVHIHSFVIRGRGCNRLLFFRQVCMYIPSSSEGRGCGRLHIFRKMCMFIPSSSEGRGCGRLHIFRQVCVQSFVITGKGLSSPPYFQTGVYIVLRHHGQGAVTASIFFSFQTGKRSCNPLSSWRRAFIGSDKTKICAYFWDKPPFHATKRPIYVPFSW